MINIEQLLCYISIIKLIYYFFLIASLENSKIIDFVNEDFQITMVVDQIQILLMIIIQKTMMLYIVRNL